MSTPNIMAMWNKAQNKVNADAVEKDSTAVKLKGYKVTLTVEAFSGDMTDDDSLTAHAASVGVKDKTRQDKGGTERTRSRVILPGEAAGTLMSDLIALGRIVAGEADAPAAETSTDAPAAETSTDAPKGKKGKKDKDSPAENATA